MPPITDQRRRPTQERARRTVERLLDAATTLFQERGYTATSMTAIAEGAGVGIGSLYQWFPTKEDLLLGLADRHLDDATPKLAATAARLREELPPLDVTARAFVEAAVEVNADDARAHRELFVHCPRTPPVLERLAALHDAMVDELVWHLRRLGLDHGDVRLRAEVAVHATDAVVHDVVIARPDGPDRSAAIDELVRSLVASLGAPPTAD